jgi:hypothetical protein
MSFQVMVRGPVRRVGLPLVEGLKGLEAWDFLPLVEDPRRMERTFVMGMTVLRSRVRRWTGDIEAGLYEVPEWIYAVEVGEGSKGGGFVANHNALDGYRLALQYGISDAVIVGRGTVAAEGMGDSGYLWQPYWPMRRKEVASALAERGVDWDKVIAEQRRLLHDQQYLSGRKFPAQVVITAGGGAARTGSADIFDARIFRERTPDGRPIETIIVTSSAGEESVVQRCRRSDIFPPVGVIAASPPGKPGEIDVAGAMQLLRREHDIRVANHDGGPSTLSLFAADGSLDQLNLTLGRKVSIEDLVAGMKGGPATSRRFFTEEPEGRISAALEALCISRDEADEVAVVAFDARRMAAFHRGEKFQ